MLRRSLQASRTMRPAAPAVRGYVPILFGWKPRSDAATQPQCCNIHGRATPRLYALNVETARLVRDERVWLWLAG